MHSEQTATAGTPRIIPRPTTGVRRFLRQRIGVFGLAIVCLMLLGAVFAPWLTPYNPNMPDLAARFAAPSLDHLIGADHLGRDVLTRALYGARIALTVALSSVGLALAAGVVLGLLAGYGPRWLDNLLLLVFDTVRSFPTIMFALAIVTLVGPTLQTVILVVVLTNIPAYARVVRTQTMSLKNAEFVVSSRSIGLTPARVLFVHVLPNVIGPVLILASMDIPAVITIEAGLSYLGLGVRPPTPSWGTMLNDGYTYIRNSQWLMVGCGLPLILTTLGFTFLGEALRDAFDPTIRRDP